MDKDIENSSLNLSDRSLVKENDEDREKENVNVVIVPESILQAIKSSSNLNLNLTDSSSPNKHIQDDNCQNLQNIETSNANNNFWISFTNDCYSDEVSQVNTKLDDACDTETIENKSQNSTPSNIDGSSGTIDINNENNSLNQFGLFQNCVIIPSYYCDNAGNTDPENNSTDNAATQNSMSRSYVVMQIQSVENEGDKNIYTLAPASTVVEPFQQFNTLPVTQASENWTPTTVTETSTKGVENAPLFLSSLPIISHQQTVKHSVPTTDQATHTSGSKQVHKCEVENCNKVFKSYLLYRKHKRTVHEKKKTYKCKYANCLWSFQTPYKLNRHLESHYKQKPFSCSFPGCTSVFSNDYNLKAHLKIHSQSAQTFACKICGEVTANKRKLETHMYKVHNEGSTFLCNICGKRCLTSAALVIHKRTHNPKLKLECPLCDKTFTKLYYLKTHLYQHTGERPYACDKCEWGFTSQSNLNRHMLTHSEKKRFKCSHKDCDTEMNRLDHLLHHLCRKQHKDGSSTDDTLQQHLDEATGKKQQYFQCEACADVFLSYHGLKRHQQNCKEHAALLEESNIEADCTSDEDHNRVGFNDFHANKNCDIAVTNVEDAATQKSSLSKVLDVGASNSSKFESNLVDVRTTLDDACSVSPTTLQVEVSANPLVHLNTDWNTTVEPTDTHKNENINDTQYLSFQTQESETQVSLVPFMEDISVLNDSATQNFLQLNDDITACVHNNTITVDSGEVEQSSNTDVLQHYVVDLNSLGSMIDINENFVIQPHPNGLHNSEQCEEVANKSLFSEGIQLPPIEDTRNIVSTAHFSGTTINLNDIH